MSDLIDIHTLIKNIKVNLLKLSKVKRTKKVLEQKYLEANGLYDKYITCRSELDIKVSKGYVKQEELKYILIICEEIESYYQRIQNFCLENEQSLSTVNTMTEFDMKTASSLLPVMTGEEECTKKLIDALEFYSQNIKKEHESLLISFVLKTRISRHAKLRLASNYDTSADLIKDMKNNLLTKQSATALQLELLQSRQGSQSIEEFGKKLEDLFVELTISQADGKEDAYKMFRPVNEKLAIQRFTEGLRNGRLSTILTARDYSELKDVIRAAKDEERAHQGHSTSAETVFAAQHRGRHRNRLRGIRYLLGLITEGAQEVLLTIREDVDVITVRLRIRETIIAITGIILIC
ncbi:hypothetical protein HF086_015970 [Spodoptera exigua]|uniref:Uncharacterized protein n=1 Tax=Spodoptera exigua TaxID=7107 RepID=A0A922S8D4_SPOEX|nr:hypothetical protein HF086_017367 [Spodoptera exigua]KAH9628440.1 hypothetical protein HF086_015970 [Spodoptera exigua]